MSYIGDCTVCGPKYKENNSRESHFSSAKYSYENARGKDSFKKDHPKLASQYDDLKKSNADIHIAHLSHILAKIEPEKGASKVPETLIQ